MRDKDQSSKAERYRRQKEAAGDAQMQIWVNQGLRARLDEIVRAGKFKNRSELVTAAVHRFIEGQTM